ncbi:GspH/FimT family pseudopilin [Desulfoluna butyratoxydans]|uniref:Type II secretion system protein H n=1 Tax=Desulfoluna butyratoxydans TaxID=231438 RepID=A0A4V6ILL0_9BACT|nr:GspH/FimT family pseudopilin [Desulfoluna butyratoxydans]VFQ45478.1 general secretion pathway gsph [Desulfoluna butyratoxydans]
MTNSRGMTLLELMVAVAILAVLAGIAVPEFKQWAAGQRLSSSARDVHLVLQAARAEAIKGGEDVVVVFTEGTGAAGQYTSFVDEDGDRSLDTGETTLESGSFPGGIDMFHARFDLNGSGTQDKDRTHFGRHGLTTGRNGEVKFKNTYGKAMRVVLNGAGTSRVETM